MLVIGIKGYLLKLIAFGINSMLLMVIGATVIAIPLFWASFRGNLDNTSIMEALSIYMVLTHIFMPRGVYKFYSAYYMPVLLIAIICSLVNISVEQYSRFTAVLLAVGLFFGFSFWHMTINRYYIPTILFFACIVITFIAVIRLLLKPLMNKLEFKINKTIISS
jgi:hypothetical protein